MRPAQRDGSRGECGKVADKLFHKPDRGQSKGAPPFVWTLSTGPLHIVQVWTEGAWKKGGYSWNWLSAHLKKVNRTETPFVIVVGARYGSTWRGCWHSARGQLDPFCRPLYGDGQRSPALAKALEPLLVEGRVDLYFGAQNRHYVRTCPMLDGRCARVRARCGAATHSLTFVCQSGVRHVYVGTAGAWPYNQSGKPDYVEAHTASWGYVALHANQTHMKVAFRDSRTNEVQCALSGQYQC